MLAKAFDLQQFAYSASHDLQEPLRTVAAYSDMLRREFGGKLGPNGDEYIGYTIQGAMRVEQLLTDLRAYTQVSSSAQEPEDDVDANVILDRALANLSDRGDSSAAQPCVIIAKESSVVVPGLYPALCF